MEDVAHRRVSQPSAFPFESQFVTVGGHRIHYVKEGNGDPVLFLHGNSTSSYVFRNVLSGVANGAGRCTIAMDLLGFGSGAIILLSKEDPDRVAAIVSHWLNELGTRRRVHGMCAAQHETRTTA